MAQGGMVCKIDVKSGRYYDGQVLRNHVYIAAEQHPDTGEPLEGVLPNWDIVKKSILEIAGYLPQLKWLGFDIAITQEGYSIIEINSHQGFHKAHEYPPEVSAFMFEELKDKSNAIIKREGLLYEIYYECR